MHAWTCPYREISSFIAVMQPFCLSSCFTFNELQLFLLLSNLSALPSVPALLQAAQRMLPTSAATIKTTIRLIPESLSVIVCRVSSTVMHMIRRADRRMSGGRFVSLEYERSIVRSNSTVNMRYTVDYCLFKQPTSNASTSLNQCTGPCAGLSESIQINLFTPNTSHTFDYCADRSFKDKAVSCASCYKVIPDQIFLSNCEFDTGFRFETLIPRSPKHAFSGLSDTVTSISRGAV